MGIMLCLLVFVLARFRLTSQQQTSTEDISKLLEKLMHHNNNNTSENDNGETPDNPEPYNHKRVGQEAEMPGNDSNIYYFKTYMAPRIKFKTNSETLHILHRANKTVHSQVDRTYEVMSEGELIPGTSKNGLVDNDEHEKLRNGRGNHFSGKESNPINQYGRSGDEIEKNFNMLEDLFQKQIVTKPTSEKSPYGHIPPKPLSLLHDYPEIVIDHISYNNDHNESGSPTKVTSIISTKPFPTETMKQRDGTSIKPTPKSNDSDEPVTTLEVIEVPKEKYPELQDFVKTIMQNKESPTTAITETSVPQSESRKQSDLIENMLQKLSKAVIHENGSSIESRSGLASIPLDTPAQANEINLNKLQILSLQNLQRKYLSRRLSAAYLPTPTLLTHKWITNRPVFTPILRPIPIKLPIVTNFLRPELQRTNVMTARKLIPRFLYRSSRPLLYGFYK